MSTHVTPETHWHSASGVGLVEVLVSAATTLAVVGAVLALLVPAHDMFVTLPESSDLAQRARYLRLTFGQDLLMAGHGLDEPESSLAHGTAAVLPYRIGQTQSDARVGVHYRVGVLSLVYVPVEPEATARLLWNGATQITGISRTYYLRPSAIGGQLMRYDGVVTDAPVLDDVVDLAFDLLAEPDPPLVVTQNADGMPINPRTTYGPLPPPIGIDDPRDGWGVGENCVFAVVAGVHMPRLPRLANDGVLRALQTGQLTDGPWCAGTTADEPFDADLLRVRRVEIRARLQASWVFRGPAGVLFRFAGGAERPSRYVPDVDAHFTVAPRNLIAAR